MGLPRRARRAYHEARCRVLGLPTQWRGSHALVEVWMEAFSVAAQVNVSPFDALRIVINRRAQRVARVDQVVDAVWSAHRKLCAETEEGDPDVPPAELRVWLRESRAEERLLAQASKLAIDAGVADALVRRWELEGRLVTDALVAGLDALNLSVDDRLRALSVMHQALARSDGGPLHSSKPLELEELTDSVVDENEVQRHDGDDDREDD